MYATAVRRQHRVLARAPSASHVDMCAQAREKAIRARARLRSEAARLAAAVGDALRHGQEEQEEGHLVEVLPQPGRQRAEVGLEEVDLRFQ